MRVYTITCHHAINHGAMLQAYALQTYLESIGYKVQIIDYLPDYLQGVKLWRGSTKYNRMGLGFLYMLAKIPSRLKIKKRERAFDAFVKQYLLTTPIHYENIEQLRDKYPHGDCYIAGSDQIWNTTFRNGTDPAFYLDFGKHETKRVSYAASFATDTIADDKKVFVKDNLKRFDKISVRELSAKRILEDLGYDGAQVVDPVFLLSKKKWDTLTADYHSLDIVIQESYVLVYDLMNDETIRNIAIKYARSISAKIYSIGPTRLPYADKNFENEGPISFIQLIKHAQCVVSNSFHGTAFAIIYHRPFWVVNRKDGLNTRMKDILLKYGIPERIITADADNILLKEKIDFSKLDQLLEIDIRSSQAFLQNL